MPTIANKEWGKHGEAYRIEALEAWAGEDKFSFVNLIEYNFIETKDYELS